jgi:hypothetical protein
VVKSEIKLGFPFMVPDLVVWFLVYIVKCHFQQYFSYIVAVTLIGGNQSTQGFKLPTSTAIGTDYIGSKSNYHTIMTMTAPLTMCIYCKLSA